MPQAVDEAGNIWETDAQGNAVRFVGQSGGQTPQTITMRRDPFKVNADNRAQDAADRAARNEARRLELEGAPKLQPGYMWNDPADPSKGARRIPGTEGAEGQGGEAKQTRDTKLANLRALQAQLDRVNELYDAGPGATKGIQGIYDFLPNETNRQFDAASAGLGDIGNAAFKVPGMGGQSDADAARFIAANQPLASDYDAQIQEKIRTIQQRLDETMRQMGVEPVKQTPPTNERLDASTRLQFEPGQSDGIALAQGPNKTVNDPELGAAINQLVRQGKTADQINAYLNQFPGASPVTQQAVDAAQRWIKQNPRDDRSVGAATKTIPTTLSERIAGTPGYAAITGATNAMTGGFNDEMKAAATTGFGAFGDYGQARDAYDAQKGLTAAAYPTADAIGTVAGGVAANLGAGALAGKVPALAALAAKYPFLAGIGSNALYGATYGAGSDNNDRASGALTGAAGALAGDALFRGGSKVLGGLASGVTAPIASRLKAQGIPLTIGQIMRARAIERGGKSFVAGAEDVIGNTPIASALVDTARNRGLEAGNRAALNTAARGRANIADIGNAGIGQLGEVKNAAYNDATRGVSLTPDQTFIEQAGAANAQGRAVDQARGRGDFGYIMDNMLAPVAGASPVMNGNQLQDILRATKGQTQAYRKAATGVQPDPMAMGVADALTGVDNAVTGLVARQSPRTIPALKEANAINRDYNILDDAFQAGRNNGGVAMPSQIMDAIARNTKTFNGKGYSKMAKQPLFRLADDMQQVLPNKVAPTGVNVAPALALGGAALTGGGQASDNDWLKALGTGLLLATPYTKTGRAAAEKLLLGNRGKAAMAIGKSLKKNSGTAAQIGAGAAVPYLLQGN